MTQDWLFRIGDGAHFKCSFPKKIWGISTKNTCTRAFLREVKQGDRLWFVVGGDGGRLLAVADFVEHRDRVLGPLISLTATNEELGWTKVDGDWDIEIHYTNLYNIALCDLFTKIKSPLVIRKYDSEKCAVNLPEEYKNIVKYTRVTREM